MRVVLQALAVMLETPFEYPVSLTILGALMYRGLHSVGGQLVKRQPGEIQVS